MAQENGKANGKADEKRVGKKLYQDPAFRHERVFETMALNCSKAAATSLMCLHGHRNAS
jgi:hypothetical protein